MSTVRIQVRRGTASQWTSVNPILAAGEMGVESDTNLFKFGNGTATWTALAYANNSDVAISEISQDAVNNALTMGSGLTKTYNDGANTITISVDNSYFTELAQDAINSAFVEGNGITKVYNDTGNTFAVAVDTSVIANKTYVTDAVAGLANTVDTDYLPVSDRGVAGGVASLNNSALIPDNQINESFWATKLDVASLSSGLQIKGSVRVASTANFASTRAAGTADASGGNGVGERLTASANGALSIDGITVAAGDRVLLKNQTDAKQNGIYTVTNAGGSSAAAVLTRATDSDNSVDGEVREGLFTFTQEGTANARDGYVLLTEGSRAGEIFQLGTDSLNFTQFTGAIPVTVGTGLTNYNDQIIVDFETVAQKSNLDTFISSTTTNFTNNTSALDSLDARLDSAEADIDAVQLYGPRLTTAETDITAIKAINVTQTTAINDLTTVNGTQSAAIAAIETKNTDQDTLLATHTTDLATKGSQITAIQGVNATQTSDITAINTSITSINTNLAPKASPTFTGTVVLPATTSIGNVSATEIAYVDGVTSGIQAQIDTKLATATAASTYATISNVALKAPLADPTFTGTVSGVTKAHVGLGNVDNTADSAKPVSTAQAAAIATAKSEALAEVTAVIAGAPAALNTLDELAAALNDDANFASTVTTAIAGKVASYTTVTNKTASFGINDADYHDGWLDVDSTGDVVIVVPVDGTNARTYAVGTSLDIFRANTGNVTITAGSGTTVNGTPGLKLRARYSSATLFKRAANTWVLIGDLTA